MFLFGSVVIYLAILGTHAVPNSTIFYGNHQVLDRNGKYHLYWIYDNTTITFEIIAKTTGYVGLGWSPKGGMGFGDIIIASAVPTNAGGHHLDLKDCHGQNENGMPNCTESQDLLPKAVKEVDGWTVVKFTRKLETCQEGDLPIKTGTMRVIWSMGKTDALEYHGSSRGTRAMYLLGNKQVDDKMPSDVKTFDMLKHNFEIPNVVTHYECEVRRLPRLKSRHHVIRIDPIITNPEYVHHITVQLCNVDLNEMDLTGLVDNTSICSTSSSTHRTTSWDYFRCRTPFFAWAVGATNFTLPQQAGIPIGTADEPQYVRIEIHYNNIKRMRGLRDNSGIRIYYTRTLRQHDAGLLIMGKFSSETLLVPPGQAKFVVYAFTASSCTEELGFGTSKETNAFAIYLHSHYAGIAIRHRHFRNGIELEPLADDQTYDFNFQQFRTFPRKVVIKQGDQFLIECAYDTTGRVNATLGGESSLEEMCLTYTFIYPRISLQSLLSYTDPDKLQELYKNNRINNNLDTSGFGGFRNALSSNIRWNRTLVNWWQEVERKQWKHINYCSASRGDNTQTKYQNKQYPPAIYSWYKPPPSECNPIN